MTKNSVSCLVTEISQEELAVRLIEIGCKIKRPVGSTGPEAWQEIVKSAESDAASAYIVRDFYAMAEAAIKYFGERINDLQKVN